MKSVAPLGIWVEDVKRNFLAWYGPQITQVGPQKSLISQVGSDEVATRNLRAKET